MTNFTHSNLLTRLIDEFPEFKTDLRENVDDDVGLYLPMGYFSEVVRGRWESAEGGSRFVERAFDFYNRMADAGIDEWDGALCLEIYADILDNPEYSDYAREKLRGRALDVFEILAIVRATPEMGWEKAKEIYAERHKSSED